MLRALARQGDYRLFLAELSAFHEVDEVELPAPPKSLANVRVMAPNVDDYWRLANEIGAQIIVPIADRYCGLRDFIIADPDRFGFASMLQRR